VKNDPLAQFREGQPSARPVQRSAAASSGKRPYEAYDKKGRPCPYTEILCIAQPSQSPQSRFFLAAVFSADFDEAFTLLYSFMAVEVRGRNLREVRQAIQQSRCEFIQEYHENEFLPPGKDAPVIESIRFITGDKLEDILSSYKSSK
jgi:hypothetical protein